MCAVAKGLNPDDFVKKDDDKLLDIKEPTLEDKLATASLNEIDEIEVSYSYFKNILFNKRKNGFLGGGR